MKHSAKDFTHECEEVLSGNFRRNPGSILYCQMLSTSLKWWKHVGTVISQLWHPLEKSALETSGIYLNSLKKTLWLKQIWSLNFVLIPFTAFITFSSSVYWWDTALFLLHLQGVVVDLLNWCLALAVDLMRTNKLKLCPAKKETLLIAGFPAWMG